jgi:hypothetical protein
MSKTMLEGLSGFLFSLSLGSIILFYVMFQFTLYENLQPAVDSVIQEQSAPEGFDESDFPNMKNDLLSRCSNSTTGQIDVELENGGLVELACPGIENAATSKEIFTMVGASAFKKAYYQEHDCSFIQCLLQEGNSTNKLAMLLSQKSHDFFGEIQIFVIAVTALFGFIFAYASGTPEKIARNFGWAFTFLGSSFIMAELFKNMDPATGSVFEVLSAKMFVGIQDYLIGVFVLGIILLIIGYGVSIRKNG